MRVGRAVDVASVLAGLAGVTAAARIAAVTRHDRTSGVLANDGWRRRAARRVRTAARAGRPVSVILLDIDDFKAVNDRDGHRAGDITLAAVATCIRRGVRACDPVGRIGGDEFAVLLDGVAAADAEHVGDRIRRLTEQVSGVTVSCGAATALPHAATTLDALVERADDQLYSAKRRRLVRVAGGFSVAGERANLA